MALSPEALRQLQEWFRGGQQGTPPTDGVAGLDAGNLDPGFLAGIAGQEQRDTPGPATPAAAAAVDPLQAAFDADQQLHDLLDQERDLKAQVTDADQAINRARATRNSPTASKEDKQRAARLLEQYFDGGDEQYPLAAYKELQTAKRTLTTVQTNIARRKGQLQKDLDTPEKRPTAPSVTQVAIPDRPGWTQPSVWDETKQGWVPAKDGAGNVLPPVPPAAEVTASIARQGKPKKGDQSWELKQSGDRWFQVPMVADEQGTWQYDTARTPQEVAALRGQPNVQVIGGVPYLLADGKLQAVPGYTKPPTITTDEKTGEKYYSTDDGKSWTKAQGLPGRPQTVTLGNTVYPLDENGMPVIDRGVTVPEGTRSEVNDGYLVRVKPDNTLERIDLLTPEQRARADQTAGVALDTARTGLAVRQAELENARRLQDPLAEYQRQVQLTQQKATSYRDDLNQQVLEGRLSVEDAQSQFDRWWDGNVETALSPYRTMAEAANRKEQNEYQRAQAAEQARVDAVNRQREQVGYQASETARNQLNALAPQARSPEFLAQLAQNVSRIGQPLPGGPAQHSGGMSFSPESLSLENVRRGMPNLTEVGQNAAARALAQISPAAAQSVGAPPPPVPSLPDVQGFMNTAPFQIPNPALAVPGQEALDLGNPANAGRLGLPVQPGFAGTRMQGGQVLPPWQIPAA